jgi:hypothetical protein
MSAQGGQQSVKPQSGPCDCLFAKTQASGLTDCVVHVVNIAKVRIRMNVIVIYLSQQ